MSNLVGNPEDRFSCVMAHLIMALEGACWPTGLLLRPSGRIIRHYENLTMQYIENFFRCKN